MVTDESESAWLIEEDLPEDSRAGAAHAPPWRVLIVDDDVDVHVVTKFSLSNATFMGRRLGYLHAYSGAEAMTILRSTPDIALILLDVIMETNEAGLEVARRTREELGNKLVRIVLRTGQPGQALEHCIILDYDINDFWCKTDLTTRKLFTTVISSLRTYSSLLKAEQHVAALEASLEKARQIELTLEQHALVLTLDQHGKINGVNERFCSLLEYGEDELLGQSLGFIQGAAPQEPWDAIMQTMEQGKTWAGDMTAQARTGRSRVLRAMIMPIKNADGKLTQCMAILTPDSPH